MALSELDSSLGAPAKNVTYVTLKVDLGAAGIWKYDTFAEFLAAVDQGKAHYSAYTKEAHITVMHAESYTFVTVQGPNRDYINKVFSIVEKHAERCRIPAAEEAEEPPRIFIGHGNNPQWRDLKDHLHEKHKYEIVAYEIGSREGHTIRDILEDMMDKASIALLVMTGEDETKDGTKRARQNVVHEAGLFQGRLGFSRAILLLEEGTEEFSNIHGLQQVRFAKGRIRETFGDVVAILKREFS